MKRVVPLLVLSALAVVGAALIVTGGSDGLSLDRVITVDGVEVDVPSGWVAGADTPFRYEPPGSDLSNVDSWTVAWACGPDGCAPRSLEEWRLIGDRLQTFVSARADEGTLLFGLVETDDTDTRILRARSAGGQTIVSVAVFHDGADHYLECNLAIAGDPEGLDDMIVTACRSASVPVAAER